MSETLVGQKLTGSMWCIIHYINTYKWKIVIFVILYFKLILKVMI